MPSYIIHSVAGLKMLERLNLSKPEKKVFIIGNILPDYVNVNIDPNIDEQERRKKIQEYKIKTHFRTKLGTNLESPDMTKLISLYGEQAKTNIATLACIFHLYTDFYFFTKTLPELVTFLDKDMNPTDIRSENVYVRINRTNTIIDKQTFWSKFSDIGLYIDYSRLNNYLMKEYGLEYLDRNELRQFAKSNTIDPKMEEIDIKGIPVVIDNLDKFCLNAKKEEGELNIFTKDKINAFFTEVVESFIETYKEYLSTYLTQEKTYTKIEGII